MIDFSKTTSNILECFDDVGNLNIFFGRLQAETGITLYEQESLIIFDEVQLFPKARQAIKHLVHDGRYSYLETGSLISIKKNVKDILIPSEEMKLEVYPMDYEEFCDATGNNSRKILRKSMHPEGYLHYIMRFRHSWQRMQESIVLPQQSGKGITPRQKNYYMS